MMRGGRDTASFMTQGGRGFASLAAACLLVFACMLGTFGLVAYAQESQSSSAAAASNGVALTDASLALHLGVLAQDAAAGMDDGTYQVEVVLTGGTGKATVESPAELAVSDGQATARLVWSSPYYDYMVVGGQKYLPVNESGNSEFLVPVIVFDKPVPVIGDTTAMSEAHEVSYKLSVLRDTAVLIEAAPNDAPANTDAGLSWPWVVFIVCAVLSVVCIVITVILLRRYRKQSVA